MLELDLLFRITGAVILLLTGLLVLRSTGLRANGIIFFLFTLGTTAYLIGNAKDRGFIVPQELALVRVLLSGNVTFIYWWFCRSLFEDDFRLGRLEWGVAAVWVSVFAAKMFWPQAPINITWLLVGLGLLLVGHVSWLLVSDRSGDLVTSRRSARLVFAAVPSAFLFLDLVIDIAFGFSWKPLAFTVWQNGALTTMAAVMAFWVLRVESGVFSEARPEHPAHPVMVSKQSSEAQKLRARVLRIMEDDKPFLDPALKFETFAKQVGVGQIRLRTLINQELGYRHFRNFLNAQRVESAKQMLADPARSADKIIAIAFDSGFASLASFNRAFMAHQGQSPSAYRAEAMTRFEAQIE